jgi:hypothetical protein
VNKLKIEEKKMERVFQNEERNAFLDKGIFGDKELLDQCILDIKEHIE